MSEPTIPDAYRQYGVTQLRIMLQTNQIAPMLVPQVNAWLAYQDREADRLKEASQAEQAEAASRAVDAAERAALAAERQATAAEKANTRATMALIIATASMIATIVGIWLVHFDALKH